MSRHRRRSIALALAGVVMAVLGAARLGAGGHAVPPPVRVQRVVAMRSVIAGARITAADLGLERIPAAYASPHQLSQAAQAIGRRAAVALPAGSPVMDAELQATVTAPGERAVALRLDDAAGIPAGDLTGARADVYITPPGSRSRSRLVLEDVLVLAATRVDGGSVATVLLPPRAVPAAIAAEAQGSLRLVVHAQAGAS
jgi:Flp pilus assembly protein CpaB